MSYKKQIQHFLYEDVGSAEKIKKLKTLKEDIRHEYDGQIARVGKGLGNAVLNVHASQTRSKTKRNEQLRARKRALKSNKAQLMHECDKAIDRVPQAQQQIFEKKHSIDLLWSKCIITITRALAALDGITQDEQDAISHTLEQNFKKLRVLTSAEFTMVQNEVNAIIDNMLDSEDEEKQTIHVLCKIIAIDAHALAQHFPLNQLNSAYKDMEVIVKADGVITSIEKASLSFLKTLWFEKNIFKQKQKAVRSRYKQLVKAEKRLVKYQHIDSDNLRILKNRETISQAIHDLTPLEDDAIYLLNVAERSLYLEKEFTLNRLPKQPNPLSVSLTQYWYEKVLPKKPVPKTAKQRAEKPAQNELNHTTTSSPDTTSTMKLLGRILLRIIAGFILLSALLIASENLAAAAFTFILGLALLPDISKLTQWLIGKRFGIFARILFVLVGLIITFMMSDTQ